jgi:hypothetical protein
MTDFATLRARLDAAELAYLQRNGFLCMYEHGEPVRAVLPWSEDPAFRVTPVGRKILRGVAAPVYDTAPCTVEAWGWDANGSFVEGAR